MIYYRTHGKPCLTDHAEQEQCETSRVKYGRRKSTRPVGGSSSSQSCSRDPTGWPTTWEHPPAPRCEWVTEQRSTYVEPGPASIQAEVASFEDPNLYRPEFIQSQQYQYSRSVDDFLTPYTANPFGSPTNMMSGNQIGIETGSFGHNPYQTQFGQPNMHLIGQHTMLFTDSPIVQETPPQSLFHRNEELGQSGAADDGSDDDAQQLLQRGRRNPQRTRHPPRCGTGGHRHR